MTSSLFALLSLVLLTNCGGGSSPTTPPPPPPPPPTSTAASISLAPLSLSLLEGEAGNLSATVRDASGKTITATVTWSIAPTGFATVNSSGRVTAVAHGIAVVTASVGSVQSTANITVTQAPVASVTLSGIPSEFEIGRQQTLQATALSASGQTLPDRAVSWSSSNQGAATVSQDGLVIGTGSGTTTITATSGGKSATATLRTDSRTGWLSRLADSLRLAFDYPALAVSIVTRDGGTFGSGQAGIRRIAFPNQVTATDFWHIGSDLKAITAHTVAIAVEQGLITWGTTLEQAYPEFAATMLPAYRPVTIRMLLGHAGGMVPNVQNPSIPGAGSLTSQRTNIAQWATSLPVTGSVGGYTYSNVGFQIAANMVERAAGVSWETFFQSQLLGPLGITGFLWGPAPFDTNQNPVGHQWVGGRWVAYPGSDNPPYLSAAGRSSWRITDWGKVIQEIMRADQGQSSLVGQANARETTTKRGVANYAAGWSTISGGWAGARGVVHDGSNNLNYATVAIALDAGLATLTVTNGHDTGSSRSTDLMNAANLRLRSYYQAHR